MLHAADISWISMVALGRIPGATRTVRLGNNPDVDAATVPETVWTGGGVYPWMTAATSLEAVSTSIEDGSGGTGAATIVVPGLDANYTPTTLTVALNGTTPVALASPLLRVQLATVVALGSGGSLGGSNVGDVIIRDAGGGTTRAIIPAGYGISRSSTYTVPANRTLVIGAFFGCINRSTNTDTVEIGIALQNSVTKTAIFPFEFSIRNTPYAHDLKDAPVVALQKTDISLRTVYTANNNTNISAAFAGVEIQNM